MCGCVVPPRKEKKLELTGFVSDNNKSRVYLKASEAATETSDLTTGEKSVNMSAWQNPAPRTPLFFGISHIESPST